MDKLDRAQKCSILGPQNLDKGLGPRDPLEPHLEPSLLPNDTILGPSTCVKYPSTLDASSPTQRVRMNIKQELFMNK